MRLFKKNKLTQDEINYLVTLVDHDTKETVYIMLNDAKEGNYSDIEMQLISDDIHHIEINNSKLITKLNTLLK